MERTLIIVKPDGVKRKIIGKIIDKFENRDLSVIKIRDLKISRELAEKHYEEHKGKSFFNELVDFITSGMVVAMVIEGHNVVALSRKLIGATNPVNAEPGTIRGDFANDISSNLIHASDSKESAEREIKLFFS